MTRDLGKVILWTIGYSYILLVQGVLRLSNKCGDLPQCSSDLQGQKYDPNSYAQLFIFEFWQPKFKLLKHPVDMTHKFPLDIFQTQDLFRKFFLYPSSKAVQVIWLAIFCI